ncbi:stem-specific protein TSJT1-like [Durio zibethinus]|uniref:Stem-specific protein TSJT1-like n=1 Tax=Durio zibethinus TaxID=66656 RepID=A0A6P5WNK3_DURZI|nr:stem-specific protein TSJT1-like [Durio zibethinus]
MDLMVIIPLIKLLLVNAEGPLVITLMILAMGLLSTSFPLSFLWWLNNLFMLSRQYGCGFDDVYYLFLRRLNNLFLLSRQYGLSKWSNEAMFVIEVCRTLRDRGPYPANQVVKDLDESFDFVIYDSKAGTVFAALGSDSGG